MSKEQPQSEAKPEQVRTIRLLKPYNGLPIGTVFSPTPYDVCRLLIEREVAEPYTDADGGKQGTPGDMDGDGRAEGGPAGNNKAFTQPPAARLPRSQSQRTQTRQ